MRAPILISLLSLWPLAVQSAEPTTRYTVTPAMDGFVRLDTNSGAMIYCRNYESTVRCEEVGVDGAVTRADEAELDDMRNRLGTLERKVTVLERDQIKLPDARDISRTIDTMDAMMRRFMESMPEHDNSATEDQAK